MGPQRDDSGGLEIIPHPPLGVHPRDLLPNRLMIIWPYTNLTDPRWRFGETFITLRQTANAGQPTKLGLAHKQKWIGYLTRDSLFIKTIELPGGRRVSRLRLQLRDIHQPGHAPRLNHSAR